MSVDPMAHRYTEGLRLTALALGFGLSAVFLFTL